MRQRKSAAGTRARRAPSRSCCRLRLEVIVDGIGADEQGQLDPAAAPPARAHARAARIPGAAAGRRLSRRGRDSRTPSARWRRGSRRRRSRGRSPSHSRSRSPLRSLKERPVSWTRVPGAWLSDQEPRRRAPAHHRPRAQRQMLGADRAGAHCRQHAGEGIAGAHGLGAHDLVRPSTRRFAPSSG